MKISNSGVSGQKKITAKNIEDGFWFQFFSYLPYGMLKGKRARNIVVLNKVKNTVNEK